MENNLPPMYKHQKEIVEMSLLQDEIALFHGLGSGKTRSVIESLRAIFNLQKRTYKVLILGVPAVIYNWKNEIIKFSNIPEKSIYVCASGTNRDKKLKKAIDSGAQIITINYEALLSEKIFQVLQEWGPQILVCDEVHNCFHEDTEIITAEGPKKIKDISKGDYVKNVLGFSKVVSTHKTLVKKVCEISFNNRLIKCSTNHKFLTKNGWVKAENLKIGDYLVPTTEAMRILSEDLYINEETEERKSREILRDILRSEMENVPERDSGKGIYTRVERENPIETHREKIPGIFRENEEKQPYENGGCKRESAPGTNEKSRVSKYIRVDDIKIQEQRSNGEYGKNYFYDLGVEGHPSYEVNGVVVHNCKNPSAKRSKKVFELSKGTFKRFILTGTPILRNMMDIFMQFKILDGGQTFGHNYFSFRAKYFVDKNAAWSDRPNHFPEWIPRADTQEELMRKIKQRAHVVETKDCIDLPPYIDTIEHVEMGKNQKIAYEQMRDYLMTFLEENMDKPAVATIAPVKALRLLQIVSGHVSQDDGKVVTFENPKLDRLMEILEDIVPENKVIIWTEFKHDITAISTELKAKGYRFVTVSGEQTTQEKQKAVDDFQNNPSVHIFLGNSQSGGTGINLTRAKYSIRFSRSFNLGNFLQSTARNYRGGSQEHDSIININLSMKDTIDEKVALALMSKEEIGKNMVNFIKENA